MQFKSGKSRKRSISQPHKRDTRPSRHRQDTDHPKHNCKFINGTEIHIGRFPNNNSATNNILEKLNKYGFGFLVAPLGKKENKEAFLANQPKLNPDIPSWSKSRPELEQALAVSQDSLTRLRLIYEMNDRLSSLKQELATIEVEKRHFEQDNPTAPPANIISLKSKEILHQIKTIEDISVRSETIQTYLKELNLQ